MDDRFYIFQICKLVFSHSKHFYFYFFSISTSMRSVRMNNDPSWHLIVQVQQSMKKVQYVKS